MDLYFINKFLFCNEPQYKQFIDFKVFHSIVSCISLKNSQYLSYSDEISNAFKDESDFALTIDNSTNFIVFYPKYEKDLTCLLPPPKIKYPEPIIFDSNINFNSTTIINFINEHGNYYRMLK